MADDVAARARVALEGVTEGPWTVDETDPGVWSPDEIVFGNYTARDDFDSPSWEDGKPADLAFIAAARSLVPELVDEVERLRAGDRSAVKRLAEDVGYPIRREEWELTGQPDGTIGGKPFPPYRFVFGNPHEARGMEGTAEERARSFIELANVDRWTDVKLRRRVVIEQPWEDQDPFPGKGAE
ncbi:hypothetical protein [Mycolicibacterium sphagni]|uniref:hypothetical protein n=1 Tax=Mycolicibacterium sphagni TaxID=1786 RepID=UPI001A9C2C3F|nr:hypothetical protein [Mycolicibacterium sphagni]